MNISPEMLVDTLNSITSYLESGSDFDDAIAKVSQERDDVLASELGQMLEEIKAGTSRRQAIQATAERVNMPDFTSFVTAAIEADEAGESILEVIRTHIQNL